MAADAQKILVGTGGIVMVGLSTATAPADSDAPLTTGWTDIGYTSEDGLTFRYGAGSDGVPVWQSAMPVRYIKTEIEAQVEIAFMEFKGDALIAAFGGGTLVAGTPPEMKYNFPLGSDALLERKLAIGWTDKGYDYRLYVPRATLDGATEIQVLRTEATTIPVTFNMLDPGGVNPPAILFTEDPGFDPASNTLD
jgi:hypothetical protein